MKRYIEVDRQRFCSALEAKGFKVDEESYGELVYEFQHLKDPTMFVKIFTSLPRNSGNARAAGADAIRVVLIFKNQKKSGGLYKAPRVYRTGTEEGVIERTLERAREAYSEANKRWETFKGK